MKKIAISLMLTAMFSATAFATNYTVEIDFWNEGADVASMGNVATDNNEVALYNSDTNTITMTTNPVNISGYISGITGVSYDTDGNKNFEQVTTVSTLAIETGTKYDGTNYTFDYLSAFSFEVPDYLSKEGAEFIDIGMKVPYTPMQVVVGDGELNARLKINWDTLEETDMETIEPNTEISSGSTVSVVTEDDGFVVTSNSDSISIGSQLKVTYLTSGEQYELAKNALGDEIGNFDIVLLSLSDEIGEVTPNSSLNVTIPYSNVTEFYRINDSGTKTVISGTSYDKEYKILTSRLGVLAISGEKVQTGFADVQNHWAKSYITDAVNRGLFNGTSDTTFSPENQMTNAMAITVLYRIAGEPAVTNASGNTWYSNAVAWGLNNEIIGGYKEFNADANVTREDLATMIYRYHSLENDIEITSDLSAFSDASSVSNYAVDGLAFANINGIITGKTATTIAPTNNATRAEVATILCRYLDM